MAAESTELAESPIALVSDSTELAHQTDEAITTPIEETERPTPAIAVEPTISQQPQVLIIQSELAKRLDVHSSTIYKRRSEPNFTDWTRNRDPEGLAWGYSEAKQGILSGRYLDYSIGDSQVTDIAKLDGTYYLSA